MLADLGIHWVIVGHPSAVSTSARATDCSRQAQAGPARKVSSHLLPGETLEQREAGETMAVSERQSACLQGSTRRTSRSRTNRCGDRDRSNRDDDAGAGAACGAPAGSPGCSAPKLRRR